MNIKNQNIVEIKINNKTYKISCGKGEETHIKNLSEIINKEVSNLVEQQGQVGESKLLLMACLIITDKMLENNNGNNQVDEKVQYELLKCISLATEKIHKVANQLRNE